MVKKGSGKPIPKVAVKLEFSPAQGEELLSTLETRFEQNMDRHQGLEWAAVHARLEAHPEKLSSLHAMESTGGEPDVVGFDQESGEFVFYDCAAQSPTGRRSICYDGDAQDEREKKGVHPAGNAVDIAAAMGVELLNEAQYRALQKLGAFDTTTSSWIQTPADIRERGGALFADRRYDTIFVYHNSAPSFYAARGFRGALRV
ncbi:MAG: DUF4256 domain-containing protein [Chloroflexi bacterium]|nr:DUF4256 domain-containing protein [Chloroflexota bacterium]